MKKISDEDWERVFGLKKEDREKEEYEEFVKHIEGLHIENIPEEADYKQSPQKIKIPKKSMLKIDDEIDLHGLTREESAMRLKEFLKNAKSERLRVVLIITGKGKHSEKGASLKPFVEKWLKNEGNEFVKSFGTAPKIHGGKGAFVVFLR